MKIIPADATINELEKQASEYESKAEGESGPNATGLREKASIVGSG